MKLEKPLYIHTHETCKVATVGANLVIYGDEALHEDGYDVFVGECILEPVPQYDR